MQIKTAKCESKWPNLSQNGQTRVKTANASWNGQTQVEMAKCKSKWQNVSQNSKMRVKTAKRESKRQNASQNGKTRVELKVFAIGFFFNRFAL